MVKIIKGNDVFIPLSASADALQISVDILMSLCHNIVKFDGIEPCISEAEFNRILKEHPTNQCNIQLTRVQSLEVEADVILSLYPLKRMFAEEMFMKNGAELGMSASEYIQYIDYPSELEKAKEKILNTKSLQETIHQYKITAEKVIANIPLEKYGLTVQYFTVLSPEKADISMFLAGNGIFRQYYPDCCDGDIWEESTMDEHGTISVPSFDYSNEKFILSREENRDFRNFTPIENVLYCVQNISADNEWTDYLEFQKGGISLSLNMHAIMKILNPNNCPNEYWINGIPDLQEKIIREKGKDNAV